MIKNKMRTYKVKTYGALNEYGEQILDDAPDKTIKMAIFTITKIVSDNSLYKEAKYIGLTLNRDIDESYVVIYEGKELKVNTTVKDGRYTQVFMTER